MRKRTERYNQAKIDRLNHIDEIFNNTMGWTIQLMNLYEERKRLRLSVSRMEPQDIGRDIDRSFKRAKVPYRGRRMGFA